MAQVRTSTSHPLQIASIYPAVGAGRIGVTFCPGKKQCDAATGAWDRDLSSDVQAISDWGAVLVISLIEQHEIDALQVPNLGRCVRERNIDWQHLPIRDVSVPDAAFERQWATLGEGVRARLRDGFDIVVHCKGGLGRAGTVAARLAVELGMSADQAVNAVRQVRPGAIETAAQFDYVMRQKAAPELAPSTAIDDIRDRAVGTLLGLAVGDAVGTTLEFKQRDTYPLLTDMVGGGPFGLQPGEWTDDTAMALALATSLLQCGKIDEADLIGRFDDWRANGAYSCTGTCFDIGMTVSAALARWRRSGDPIAGATAPDTAGNGSLMRLAPVAVRYWNNRPNLRDAAARQSMVTHGAPEAVDACVAYAEMLADAIGGGSRSQVLAPSVTNYAGEIAEIIAGSWRGQARENIASSGYVAHALEDALWSVGASGDFAGSILRAANLGSDADTTAAIAGQLAGALYGRGKIPPAWIGRLAWRAKIEAMANELFDASVLRTVNRAAATSVIKLRSG